MNWVGYKVHLSETCDEDHPHLITQVTTTLATTSDFVMGEPIEQDLADRDLLPGSHLFDSGYVVAELLVSGPRKHQIDVVGHALRLLKSSTSREPGLRPTRFRHRLGGPTGDLSSRPSQREVDAWAESIGLTRHSHPV